MSLTTIRFILGVGIVVYAIELFDRFATFESLVTGPHAIQADA